MTTKEKFNKALTHIKRDGVDSLVAWLETETDFFECPASTRFHGNFEGGLLEHSINVLDFALTLFNRFVQKKPELEYLRESVIIASLFHDVAKVNCYSKEKKWTKDSNNKWVEYLGWVYKDSFPLGHGEKSIFYISKHVELTDVEALAIRWHMGPFEVGASVDGPMKWSYSSAAENPIVRLIHAADVMATTVENTIDYKELASK